MITTLLAIVGMIAIPAVTFIAGVMCSLKEFQREAPDLFAEWEHRRDAGEVRK